MMKNMTTKTMTAIAVLTNGSLKSEIMTSTPADGHYTVMVRDGKMNKEEVGRYLTYADAKRAQHRAVKMDDSNLSGKRPFKKSNKTAMVRSAESGKEFPLYQRKLTGRDVPCTGEAHSNAYIDNCGACAPRWGIVAEREPELTTEQVAEVNAKGFAVAVNDTVYEQILECPMVMVTQGKGRSFYAILPEAK